MSNQANDKLKASPLCLSVVKSAEGFRAKAYLDTKKGRVPTIGYGHTAGVKMGDTCTQDRANAWLITDIAYAEGVVKKAVDVALSQGQFDALVSFVYNVGPGRKGFADGFVTLRNGNPSSLLRLLNAGDAKGAADQFERWVYDEGVKLPGLVKRRLAEKTLFLEA